MLRREREGLRRAGLHLAYCPQVGYPKAETNNLELRVAWLCGTLTSRLPRVKGLGARPKTRCLSPNGLRWSMMTSKALLQFSDYILRSRGGVDERLSVPGMCALQIFMLRYLIVELFLTMRPSENPTWYARKKIAKCRRIPP